MEHFFTLTIEAELTPGHFYAYNCGVVFDTQEKAEEHAERIKRVDKNARKVRIDRISFWGVPF